MDWSAFYHSATFAYIVLPLLIFCSRIVDVSIGTMRVIFITKGYRWLAPLFGFFEVLIWLVAMSQIMKNLSNVFCYIAYAGGFATGNFVGMFIERKMALGVVLVRVITRTDASALVAHLKSRNYGVTAVNAEGLFGKVKILFTIVKRTELATIIETIKRFNPQAFYSIEDIRQVSEPVRVSSEAEPAAQGGLLRMVRVGK